MGISWTLQGIYSTSLSLIEGDKFGRALKIKKFSDIAYRRHYNNYLNSIEHDPTLSTLIDK